MNLMKHEMNKRHPSASATNYMMISTTTVTTVKVNTRTQLVPSANLLSWFINLPKNDTTSSSKLYGELNEYMNFLYSNK